jgi:hypothetical protein
MPGRNEFVFRWFIPGVCATIGITNECKIMQDKTQQLYYVVEIR